MMVNNIGTDKNKKSGANHRLDKAQNEDGKNSDSCESSHSSFKSSEEKVEEKPEQKEEEKTHSS